MNFLHRYIKYCFYNLEEIIQSICRYLTRLVQSHAMRLSDYLISSIYFKICCQKVLKVFISALMVLIFYIIYLFLLSLNNSVWLKADDVLMSGMLLSITVEFADLMKCMCIYYPVGTVQAF